MDSLGPYRGSGASSRSAHLTLVATTARTEDLDHSTIWQLGLVAAVAIALAIFGPPIAPLLFVVGGALAVNLWRKRREQSLVTVTISITDGRLLLSRPGLGSSVRLAELRAVSLSEEEPGFAIVGHGVRKAGLAGAGRSRIVFRTMDHATSLLPIEISHTECFEWIPKIRQFLKENGWVPPEESDLEGPGLGPSERHPDPARGDDEGEDDDEEDD